jgi:2-dehydropantoate 2-reductase
VRVAVLGAGAIGAYVGAALWRAGVDVHLIARGAHLEAMKVNGVQVRSDRGDFVAHPHATSDPREVGPVDVVFLGLKAYSYADCGELLDPLTNSDTAVVAAQNGIPWWYFHGIKSPLAGRRIEAVDPGGAVSAVIPPERAIGCVVYSSTELDGPGVVRHIEGTRFSIGEPDMSSSQRCADFSAAMIAGGLKCPVETDLRRDIWLKLMGNISFNPLSALTGATMAEIARDPDSRGLVVSMMEETLAVARALNCEPEISLERRLAGAERVGDHKTSMLLDLEAGKPMEIGAIMRAPIEIASWADVPVPSLEAVASVLSLLERKRTK